MSYLIDTNVVSELRKGRRCDPRVSAWFRAAAGEEKFLSVLTIGEIRRGIDSIKRRDERSAQKLEVWLARLRAEFAARILIVSEQIAETWGRLMVPDPLPVVDSMLAATAIVHGLTLVTRNADDVGRTGVPLINPFEEEAG
ncbi:MAG TPA: type II toxin-antitoxin system VapC family toxin [Vicinamibacteria bacterium]|nr:type II toxin-antitoxin system VapC family toxin [Vicinamibacteria bacterium]